MVAALNTAHALRSKARLHVGSPFRWPDPSLATKNHPCSCYKSLRYDIYIIIDHNGSGVSPIPEVGTSPEHNWWEPRRAERKNQFSNSRFVLLFVLVNYRPAFFRLPVFFLVRPVTSNLRRSSVQSPKRCTTKSLGSWNFSTRSTGVEGKRIFPPGENGGVRKTKGLIFLIEDLLGTNGIDVNIWLARSNVSYFLN